MGTTNQTADGGSNIDERDVNETVRDTLQDRIVTDVHVNPAEYLVAVEFGVSTGGKRRTKLVGGDDA